MTDTSSLDSVAEACFAKLEEVGGDPSALPVRERAIAVVYSVQGIIDNGGFQYLFESDFPGCPPYSLIADAYRHIGASEAASSLEQAVSMFPFPQPHRSQAERIAFMKSLPPTHQFFQLGDGLCGNKGIWQALEKFALSAGSPA